MRGGIDFSRGFRNPEEREIMEALREALAVVAKSTEQVIGLPSLPRE